MKLPEKYETRIGEHGASLSGGQRQRLAIAMSLVTNPQILVLDDSTSALDAETESKIRATLKQIMKDRTAFVITHRVATARDADIILVLEGGKITEMGNHESSQKVVVCILVSSQFKNPASSTSMMDDETHGPSVR